MELVVIPNKSDYAIAWCVDYALSRIESGESIGIMDLSDFQLRYRYFGRRFLERALSKRPMIGLVKHLIRKGIFVQIKYKTITASMVKKPQNFSQMVEDTIKSAYAFDYGTSKIQISDIDQVKVAIESEIFETVYSTVIKTLEELKPSKLVTVNGRFVVDSAALLAARTIGIPSVMLERTSENFSYYSVHKVSSQSPREVYEIILQVWRRVINDGEKGTAEQISRNFFSVKSRFSRISRDFEDQKYSKEFLSNTAIFFPTSDHEFAIYNPTKIKSVGSDGQLSSFAKAIRILRDFGINDVIVRTHPHPDGSKVGLIEDSIWKEFCSQNDAHFIGSGSPIDSYYLASNSRLNIVSSSSLGAEISYAGYPVIFTDESTYGYLLSDFLATTEEELVDLISARPRNVDPSRLDPWGYYMATGENRLKYIEMDGTDSFKAFGKIWAVPRKNISKIIFFVVKMKQRLG